VRRLNRYVEEQAPWQLAKDPERAADLDRVLRTLAEGLRVVTVLLSPWIPAPPRSSSPPWAPRTSAWKAPASGPVASGP
jgi:methionyl-tRNA synthetase